MNLLRLKEIREDRDLRQCDVAKALNITQVVYSRYETGARLIPIDKLDELANFYDVSIDYLLCRTDEKGKYPRSLLEKNRKIKRLQR